jgi:hypothetical protein
LVECISNYDYWETVRRELTKNQPRAHELSAPDRPDNDTTGVANSLREIVEGLQPMSAAIGCELQLELLEYGTTRTLETDLRTAIRALLESSLGQGSHQLRVVSKLDDSASGRQLILIEVLSDALDVPDAVRRKLSKAVIAHAGETSFISAPTGSCVRIRIPRVAAQPKSANRRVRGELEKALPRRTASSGHLANGLPAKSSSAAPEISEYVPRF